MEASAISPRTQTPKATQPSDDLWFTRVANLADFGDERLNLRFALVLGAFASQPEASLAQACGDPHQAKAAYRFFANDHVTPEAVSDAAAADTVQSLAGAGRVYVVHDTTSLNFSRVPERAGLGPLCDLEAVRGLHLHSSLAVDERGVLAGVLNLRFWNRGKEKVEHRDSRPIEDKESYKWIAGVEAVGAAVASLAPDRRPEVVHVMDAEGDVHEVFERFDGCHGVVAACQNRSTSTGELAFDLVGRSVPLGMHKVRLPKRDDKPEREATLTVRVVETTLVGGSGRSGVKPTKLRLVEAVEESPPEGAEAVRWRLWTTLPVDDLAAAAGVMRIYGLRWVVEEYHRTLKSGLRIERMRLESPERLMNGAATAALAAARLVAVRDLAKREPDAPATTVLTAEEVAVLVRRFNPKSKRKSPPTVLEALLWIGRLGGHRRTKRCPTPGLQTLWRGWRDLQLMTAGWRLR